MKKILLACLLCVSITAFAAINVAEQTTGKITTSKTSVMSSSPGMIQLAGKVKNNDSTKHSFVITITFVDNNGDIQGTAIAIVNDLEAGQSKTYQAMGQSIHNNYTKIEVQIDSID